MVPSSQGKRDDARQQLKERMSAKTAQEKKERTVQLVIAGVVGLVLVGVIVWGVVALSSDDDTTGADNDDSATSEEDGPDENGEAGEPVDGDCLFTPVDGGDVPPADFPEEGTQIMTIETNHGDITAEIDTAEAPCTSSSYTFLAEQDYFDDTRCHRLTTDGIFVLQCGDPNTEGGIGDDAGAGGPGYQFPEENLPEEEENNYPAGTIAMANAGPDTTGSQFFLVYDDTSLPADYTVLGEITEGLDIVEDIADDGVEEDPEMPDGDGTPVTEVVIETLTMSEIS